MINIQLPDPSATMALVSNLKENLPGFGRMVDHLGHAAAALRQLGLTQWANGRLDVAVQAFSSALSLTSKDSDLWRDLASVYDASGHPQQALAAIQKSLEINPGSAQSWLILGGLADRQDHIENAEVAYRQAIALDETLAPAHLGLGLLLFRRKRFDEALVSVRSAVAHDGSNGLAHYALGHLSFIASKFMDCANALQEAAQLGVVLDLQSRQKWVRAVTFQAMIEGRVQAALDQYPAIAGEDAEGIDTIARDAFSVLSASGHLEAAAEVGRMRLAEKPDDPVRKYLLDAVSGRSLTAAPTDYIEQYFDQFAPQFDSKLTETLQYSGPSQMTKLLARHRAGFKQMLDLGCGTGLAAGDLSLFGETLVGVDLSAGMLAEAAKRGRYSELVKSEAVAYLETHPNRFDLVFAADSLIYFGDLGPVLRAAAGALTEGGLFALSIEVASEEGFVLRPSGRFAHSLDYLTKAATDFVILETVETNIRLEAGRPVSGLYVLMERR